MLLGHAYFFHTFEWLPTSLMPILQGLLHAPFLLFPISVITFSYLIPFLCTRSRLHGGLNNLPLSPRFLFLLYPPPPSLYPAQDHRDVVLAPKPYACAYQVLSDHLKLCFRRDLAHQLVCHLLVAHHVPEAVAREHEDAGAPLVEVHQAEVGLGCDVRGKVPVAKRPAFRKASGQQPTKSDPEIGSVWIVSQKTFGREY